MSENNETKQPHLIDPTIKHLAEEARKSHLPNFDAMRSGQLGRSLFKDSNFNRFGAVQKPTYLKHEHSLTPSQKVSRMKINRAKNLSPFDIWGNPIDQKI